MHAHPPSAGGRATPGRLSTLFQRSVDSYLSKRRLPDQHAKVLRAVASCRTAAAGGHINVCEVCGHTEQACNSCQNRHCPTCQWPRQRKWVSNRLQRMLPVRHFHVVFTLPSELRPLAAFNPEVVYDRAMKAAARTLTQLCADRLGVKPGITAVLHTWTRELLRHPHIHCIVSAGGLDLQAGEGFKPIDGAFLLPVAVMASLFRGKLLNMLKAAHRTKPLHLPDALPLSDLLRPLHAKRWVVFAKARMDSRKHVVRYLGAYTHRVAISESRVLHLDEHGITFRARGARQITLTDEQFLDRFRLHILPKGFRKVRHNALYAPGNAARLQAVGENYAEQLEDLPPDADTKADATSGRICPCCEQGVMVYLAPLAHPPDIVDSS